MSESSVVAALTSISAAEQAFQSGRPGVGLALIDAALGVKDYPVAVERRLRTARGMLLCDVGRWTEASDSLTMAAALAEQIGDASGILSVQVNLAMVYNAQWNHRQVIAFTADVALCSEADPPVLRMLHAGLLLNRAQAGLAVRLGSVAIPAATEALRLGRLPDALPNPLYLAIAVNYAVRGHLLAGDIESAKAVLATVHGISFPPRGAIQIVLAQAAVASESLDWPLARTLLEPILNRDDVPVAVRRDALGVLLRVEQNSGSANGVLAVLERLADIVVAHRTQLVRSELSMAEETAPGLKNLQSAEMVTPDKAQIFAKIVRVIEASEVKERFERRMSKAILAARLAGYLGYGSNFVQDILRGALASTFGAFTQVLPQQISADDPRVVRLEIADTVRIFAALGVPSSSVEYRIAEQFRERGDGSGPLGQRADAICREAAIVGICSSYVETLSAHGLAARAHREFVASVMVRAGYDYPVEVASTFASFIERIWREQLKNESTFFSLTMSADGYIDEYSDDNTE